MAVDDAVAPKPVQERKHYALFAPRLKAAVTAPPVSSHNASKDDTMTVDAAMEYRESNNGGHGLRESTSSKGATPLAISTGSSSTQRTVDDILVATTSTLAGIDAENIADVSSDTSHSASTSSLDSLLKPSKKLSKGQAKKALMANLMQDVGQDDRKNNAAKKSKLNHVEIPADEADHAKEADDDDDDIEIVGPSKDSIKAKLNPTRSSAKSKSTIKSTLVSRASPTASSSQSSRETPVIVISDSPERKKSAFIGNPNKRAVAIAVLERWPTAMEHRSETTTNRVVRISPMVEKRRWVRQDGTTQDHLGINGNGKGKGRALIEEEDDFLQSFARSSSTPSSTTTASTNPSLIYHQLSQLSTLPPPDLPQHPLLQRLSTPFSSSSSSTFNSRQFECRPFAASTGKGIGGKESEVREKELFTVRYAPRTSEEVLGLENQASARLLRDWLNEMKIGGNSHSQSSSPSLAPLWS
jgi:hypothetical protein